MFGQGLDSVELVGVDVDGLVDNTVGSNSQNRDEFKSIRQNTSKPIFWGKTC